MGWFGLYLLESFLFRLLRFYVTVTFETLGYKKNSFCTDRRRSLFKLYWISTEHASGHASWCSNRRVRNLWDRTKNVRSTIAICELHETKIEWHIGYERKRTKNSHPTRTMITFDHVPRAIWTNLSPRTSWNDSRNAQCCSGCIFKVKKSTKFNQLPFHGPEGHFVKVRRYYGVTCHWRKDCWTYTTS